MNKLTILTLTALLLVPLTAIHAAEDLEKNFVNPPDSAKASGYWWWLNANVDKEAITRDMDEFSAKGIGSVLLVCSGNWAGPVASKVHLGMHLTQPTTIRRVSEMIL